MKFINSFRVLFLTASVYLSACQKEITTNTSGPADIKDSTFLDYIYDLEKNPITNTFDTTYKQTYYYDSNKRVIKIYENFYSTSTVNHFIETSFFYTSNDTLPYKSIVNDKISALPDQSVSERFHFYNAQGKKIKDSILKISSINSDTIVSSYTYGNNSINKITVFKQLGGFQYIAKDSAIINSLGNVINARNFRALNPNSIVPEFYRETNYTYDDKPSPYYKLSCSKAFDILPPVDETFLMQCPNNITSIKTTPQTFADIMDVKNTYIYNTSAYPKSFDFTNYYSTPPDTFPTFLVYKQL
jgi:hypothetical protein